MANFIGAAVIVALFGVLIHLLGIVDRTRDVVSICRNAVTILQDPRVADDEKEKQMRQNSLRLFTLLAILIAGTLIAVTLPLFAIWLVQFSGLWSVNEVLNLFLRWDFLIGATVFGVLAYLASVKWLSKNS